MRSLCGLSALAMAFDSLVHPSVADRPVLAAIHRNYIALRLAAGFAAGAAFPVYLGLGGVGHVGFVGLFALLIAPVVSAIVLSWTGDLRRAALATTGVVCGIVVLVSQPTGGLASPYLAWCLIVPLEAALSRDRGTVVLSSLIAAATLGLVYGRFGFDDALLRAAYADGAWQPLAILAAAILQSALNVILLWSRESELVSVMESDSMRHRLLAENATDVVSRHDASGRPVYVSPAAARLFNMPGSALTGDRWADRIHPVDREVFSAAMVRVCETGREVACEFRMRRARLVPVELRDYASDDEYVWVETRCRPTRPDEGLDGDIVAVTRDVSARKAQERALDSARQEAERADQAKTRFLANVSHELRTPLNAIIGFSDLLKDEVNGPIGHPSNREYVEIINKSGNHLLQLVNDILDMSKLEAGQVQLVHEPFDVRDLLHSCVTLMDAEARQRGVHIDIGMFEGTVELNADRRACKQILLNLLSNAVKFTPGGGQISVSAEFHPEAVMLAVRDTGIGIEPATLARLGKPFVQADTTYRREHDGAGLGLSVVRALVELHQGTFEIESTVGVGTVAKVTLPRHSSGSLRTMAAGGLEAGSADLIEQQARAG